MRYYPLLAVLAAIPSTSLCSTTINELQHGQQLFEANFPSNFPKSLPSVTLGNTIVIGSRNVSFGHEFFGGIPYAEAPLGPLRLKKPVPKFELDVSTFNATNWGSACLQWPQAISPIPASIGNSEDCLKLNVLRPTNTTVDSKLPVLVFMIGGGFIFGSSANFSGTAMVQQSVTRGTPMIYVNFNYRLGPLGFPQGREAIQRDELNLGLKDQLTALEWIHRNIENFGGDSSRITVAGQSAGSISIALLLLNSNLDQLARNVIMQSGFAGTTTIFDATHRERYWYAFVSAVPQCHSSPAGQTFECLRHVNSSTLLAALENTTSFENDQFPWVPVIDGPNGLIPDRPSVLFANNQFLKMNFISGCVLDEGAGLIRSEVNSTDTIIRWIIANYTTGTYENKRDLYYAAERLLELYPDDPALGSPYFTGNETFGKSKEYKRLAAIMGDLQFHSARRQFSQVASHAGVKHYNYHFTDPIPPNSSVYTPSKGVTHGTDLQYLLGILVNGTREAYYLAAQMRDYWISFVASGDPNDRLGTRRPTWSPNSAESQLLLELNREHLGMVKDDYRFDNIAYINSNTELFDR